jgi:hypothetical protein
MPRPDRHHIERETRRHRPLHRTADGRARRPYFLFTDAGPDVTVASPLGGASPVDEASLAAGFVTPAGTRFRRDPPAAGQLTATARLADTS